MNYTNAIDFLLEKGCPSIVYRTKTEILKESPGRKEYDFYQNQILQDDRVRHILSLQREDGWLGGSFHGEDEPESGIRMLCEKGLDRKNPAVLRALAAIEERGSEFDQGNLYRVGKLLDEANLGGSCMIKACVYAYAGIDDTEFMKAQIDKALAAFRFVIAIEHLDDVYLEKKGKCIFRAGVAWPGIYHLRLLAFTNSWRNNENRDMLVSAMKRLCSFGTIPSVSLLHRGQMIAPGSFCMNDFAVKLSELGAKEWMMWFCRMELIARLGVLDEVPEFRRQMEELESMLEQGGGTFRRKLSHYYFHKWTPYFGLALERDWKKKNARECDLTFRSLLILKQVGKL